MNGKPTRVMIADDHSLVRLGMRELLSHEPDIEICGEAASVADALKMALELTPDVIVVDLTFGDGTGIEFIKQLRLRDRNVKMIVSTMHDESLFGERCFRAGAAGFVNKEEASEKVVEAIRSVMSGKLYLSPRLADRVLNRALGGNEVRPTSALDSLTDRELEVFAMIGRGLTTRQIAEKLYLSHKTIESYRENIKSKLRLRNAAELNRHAVQWALEGTHEPASQE
ncbi:MAG: response regulator transcription factor [Planctomycetaceae bacterium]|nr:response regulator transcription factor [Planctomycetaceae bacterium]